MEDHLGYAKHNPAGCGSGDSRNGSTAKTVPGGFSEARIRTSRYPDGSFGPKIPPKRETSPGDFAEKIVSLCARGAIESLNAELPKNIANRKVLSHDAAVLKLLFLNSWNFSNR